MSIQQEQYLMNLEINNLRDKVDYLERRIKGVPEPDEIIRVCQELQKDLGDIICTAFRTQRLLDRG